MYSPELRRLIEFAATDTQFAQILIADAPTALQGEIFGRPFNLLSEEEQAVISIQASNLSEFVSMLTNGRLRKNFDKENIDRGGLCGSSRTTKSNS